ncbi:MAG: helix-turn-helix domain-containing protein [Ruminococcaceae bacterium]|nr:helix-turn-helix domain-containing protein [Oscillospiraceae bacterium]
MEKYKKYYIRKSDIEEYSGLGEEELFAPLPGVGLLPLEISCFGITHPDKDYKIKRSPSPCFIIEYVASGKGYIKLNGKRYNLSSGDTYIIHPGDFCEYWADADEPYEKYWINFRSNHFFEFLEQYDINDRIIRGIDLSERFAEIFALELISQRNDELYIPATRILVSIMLDILEYKRSTAALGKWGLAARVKDILQHSLSVPITLEDLEKEVFYSKNDIIRSFKKEYGITPYAYLIDLRTELAKKLLSTTQKSVKEIGEYLCFSSQYYFSNCFKEKTGMSPLQFRKASREKSDQ